ncbi:MAG: KpsF/GutQ family sugar-phosphate isomerase [Alphaproteobacteria bacterium]|nr:KpsF/GutQ family sugar-phosphate isomerase [Alphaproteobacteria bacterium]
MDLSADIRFRKTLAELKSNSDLVESGQSVIRQEAAALSALADSLDEKFGAVVELIIQTRHRVVVTGIGKSGHIARKIAATLSATGTPAYFVHAAESAHGDLGMLMQGDCLLAFSNSGTTPELQAILSYAKQLSIPIIGVASRSDSPLALQSTVFLRLPQAEEACPVKIAPTTSTTMMLALGDALAIAAMRIRGTSLQDLAQWHPGGNIGRRLMPVEQLIRRDDPLPLVSPDTRMRDVILEMTSSGKGVAGVIDTDGKLIGIITDGDLRREFDRIIIARAGDIMTRDPVTITSGTLVEDAYTLLNGAKIMAAFVMDPDDPAKPVGLLHIHDLAIGI